MDSVTQAALGAVVGHSLMGRKIGYIAPVIGAALGTLPDLDVLIAFGGAVEDFTYHRGFSHSLFVQLLATPILVWIILKYHTDSRSYKKHWAVTVLAILWTHSFLDSFTVYGTQLLWPLTDYPFGISSVFIIDPFYTLPLLISLFLASMWGWKTDKANKVAFMALFISSAYLLWSLAAKTLVHQKIDAALTQQSIEAKALLSTPTPFNTFIWRVVILEENQYRVSHIALWESPETVDFRPYPKGEHYLESIHENWDATRLSWFTKGFYRAADRDGQLVITDLRMGFENNYAFNFAIGYLLANGTVEERRAERIEDQIDMSRLALIWHRLWDVSVSLHPAKINDPEIPYEHLNNGCGLKC